VTIQSSRINELRSANRNRQVRWGFIWALWCAVLWGAWYVPGSAVFFEEPMASLVGSNQEVILGALVVTVLNAVAVLIAMFVWVSSLGKVREYVVTLRQPRISMWYIPAAVCGMTAIFGTYLAITFVGAAFGAVAGLLYPLAGTMVARLWYNEKITGQAAIGIVVMVFGAATVFTPGLWDQLTSAGGHAWIGYLGGLMAIAGWGTEGAIAGRALDVSDPDVGLALRFTAEVAIWLVVIVPGFVILEGRQVFDAFDIALGNPVVMFLLIPLGLTFGFCYVAWYKSFPLIGVGRGQAIAALYGPAAIIWLWLFSSATINWQFIVGCILAVGGSFLLFTERRDVLEVIRAIEVKSSEPMHTTKVEE
jgi:drug/metabolite transporter (DMT)-like permease